MKYVAQKLVKLPLLRMMEDKMRAVALFQFEANLLQFPRITMSYYLSILTKAIVSSVALPDIYPNLTGSRCRR